MPDDSKNQSARQPLDYGRRDRPRRGHGASVLGQAALGMLTSIVTLAMFVGIAFETKAQPEIIGAAAIVLVIGLAFLASWTYARLNWRGFISGMILGFVLTCLVPVGWFFLECYRKPLL